MNLKEKIRIPKYSLGEELMNSITHGIGAIFSIVALILLILKSVKTGSALAIVSSAVYGASSIMLFTISCIYHALAKNNGKRVFRIIDHCTIYLLIAGTYTPYALIALPAPKGIIIFAINWLCAIIGIILNSIDLEKFKKISMVLYLVMGWMVIFTFSDLLKNLPLTSIIIMLTAGILYTVGAIFYGIGKNKKYMHSIFHIFVLIAAVLFFISIYCYVI